MFQIVFIFLFLSFLSGFALSQNQIPSDCPTLKINAPDGVTLAGDSIKFQAEINGTVPSESKINWAVNQGKIVSGQGTREISVSTRKDFAGTSLIATLEIGDLPDKCSNSASNWVSLGPDPKEFLGSTDGCPSISVTGPAGISIPGEIVTYIARVEGEVPEKVEYRWSAVHGEIVDGRGTLSVKVRTPTTINSTLTVTIELVGLPKTCPNSASESAPIACICAAILIDEFETKVNRIDEIRLRNSLRTNKLDRYDQLYVIEYFPPEVSEAAIRKRQNKLRAFLAKQIGRDIASVTIVISEAVTDGASMKVYRVPPGAANPTP